MVLPLFSFWNTSPLCYACTLTSALSTLLTINNFYDYHCENPHFFLPWADNLFLCDFEDLNHVTSHPLISRLPSQPSHTSENFLLSSLWRKGRPTSLTFPAPVRLRCSYLAGEHRLGQDFLTANRAGTSLPSITGSQGVKCGISTEISLGTKLLTQRIC